MMKALIAMSGGVDSSVAAHLTLEAGFDCVGCTMKLYANEDAGVPREHSCCSLDDVEDARAVARRLGIPYYVFNFSDTFREKVMEPFFASYLAGETPNPCVECNRYLKFDRLYLRAQELGCHTVVTGHYARIQQGPEGWLLKKALDPDKDQTYFLYAMTQEQLAHTRFPLGEMTKPEVRALADRLGFVNARKPDSQDICFVPDGDYARVLELHTGRPAQPGNYIDAKGNILGQHRGVIHYTVGQRRGLGITFGEPWYVTAIDPAANTVTLGPREELFSSRAALRQVHWISGHAPQAPIRCAVKLRSRHREQPALLTPVEEDCALVLFDQPQRAVTPGQAAVIYHGDTVLGGGVITRE